MNAKIETSRGDFYEAKWKPSEACEPYMDEEGRVLSRSLAENVVSRIYNKPGTVDRYIKKISKKNPPLPHSLSSLQIEAAKVFGLSAQTVLDTCQSLYERHRLITYPRSDCRYLPKSHLKDVQAVAEAIKSVQEKLAKHALEADLSLKSSAWNDKKVGAHHAIIPTSRKVNTSVLSKDEQNIYYLIARHYLVQFYSASEYSDKEIVTIIEGGKFVSKQKDLIKIGWQVLFPAQKKNNEQSNVLPEVIEGETVKCVDACVLDKNTTPPKRFTDASLLAAMTGISRYVSSPDIKKVLKETDGIGTEATRAGIIELLFKRLYLVRKGKEIYSTDIGKSVISALPDDVGKPDMTAIWESELESIYLRKKKYQDFMNGVTFSLGKLLDETRVSDFTRLKGKGVKKTFRPKRKTGYKRKSYPKNADTR